MAAKKVTEMKKTALDKKCSVPTVKKTPIKKPQTEIIELPTIEKSPTLKKGTKEIGYVTLLQSNLKFRGYYDGPVDGRFGDATEKAVMDFQKDCGKPQTGIVGPKIWGLLKNSDTKRIDIKLNAPVAVSIPQQSIPGSRVLIEGLTKYQADLLIMLLQGNTECRIL